MDVTNADEEQTSCNDFDGTLEPEERLLQTYKKVLWLIRKDAFWNNVGKAFEKTYPGIKESLKEQMKDLEKRDCGIVVAGETSTGKSTLINKLIGHDALVWGTLETTKTIYRVMHSEKMSVKTYRSGCPEPTRHSFNSVHELHKMLRELEEEEEEEEEEEKEEEENIDEEEDEEEGTDKEEDTKEEKTKDNMIYQVDVLLPFSKIQNRNVAIVDTPGVGDSRELKTKLEEYIPKAVAFVIVLDVSRAGGLQKHTVMSLLSTIKSSSTNMKCFELDDILFVRNKWDNINAGKKQRDKLKKKLTARMKAEWPWVKDSQIFDICLIKKSSDDLSEYTLRYEQFDDAIHDLVKKKENIRIQTHGQYLSGVILEARKVLSEALTAIEKQIDGSDTIFQNFTEHMTKTNQAIKKVQNDDIPVWFPKLTMFQMDPEG
ncbi:uncharacterized protein in xynA 3'region-like [Magallana gigas]|uniref:uncharacterized protein in xynA 3'region-like n=1 Tax=Magallana gigas TaxID=29159 RepID=UPI0033418FBA